MERGFIEIVHIPDVWVEGIGGIELVGDGCCRVIFYATLNGRRVVVDKHIRPIGSCLGQLPRLITRAQIAIPMLSLH